eukprot:502281_1
MPYTPSITYAPEPSMTELSKFPVTRDRSTILTMAETSQLTLFTQNMDRTAYKDGFDIVYDNNDMHEGVDQRPSKIIQQNQLQLQNTISLAANKMIYGNFCNISYLHTSIQIELGSNSNLKFSDKHRPNATSKDSAMNDVQSQNVQLNSLKKDFKNVQDKIHKYNKGKKSVSGEIKKYKQTVKEKDKEMDDMRKDFDHMRKQNGDMRHKCNN